jgi:hypothetical protein
MPPPLRLTNAQIFDERARRPKIFFDRFVERCRLLA